MSKLRRTQSSRTTRNYSGQSERHTSTLGNSVKNGGLFNWHEVFGNENFELEYDIAAEQLKSKQTIINRINTDVFDENVNLTDREEMTPARITVRSTPPTKRFGVTRSATDLTLLQPSPRSSRRHRSRDEMRDSTASNISVNTLNSTKSSSRRPIRIFEERQLAAQGMETLKTLVRVHCDNCPCVPPEGGLPQPVTKWQKVRVQAHITFEDAESSRLAKFVNFIITTSILLSTFAFCLETLPDLESSQDIFDTIDIVVVAIFTLEYLVRLISVDSMKRFHKNWLNIIDLVAILPFYVGVIFGTEFGLLRVLRAVRLVRLFRVFKIPSLNSYTRILEITIRKSSPMLFAIVFVVFLAIVIFSSLYFAFEKGSLDRERGVYLIKDINGLDTENEFQSIMGVFWWALQTLTAVGYGDVIPDTPMGKVVTCITSILGILVLSLPISIMGTFFTHGFHEVRSEEHTISELLLDLKQREYDLAKRFRDVSNLLEGEILKARDSDLQTPEHREKYKQAEFNAVANVVANTVLMELRAVRKFLETCRMLPDPDIVYVSADQVDETVLYSVLSVTELKKIAPAPVRAPTHSSPVSPGRKRGLLRAFQNAARSKRDLFAEMSDGDDQEDDNKSDGKRVIRRVTSDALNTIVISGPEVKKKKSKEEKQAVEKKHQNNANKTRLDASPAGHLESVSDSPESLLILRDGDYSDRPNYSSSGMRRRHHHHHHDRQRHHIRTQLSLSDLSSDQSEPPTPLIQPLPPLQLDSSVITRRHQELQQYRRNISHGRVQPIEEQSTHSIIGHNGFSQQQRLLRRLSSSEVEDLKTSLSRTGTGTSTRGGAAARRRILRTRTYDITKTRKWGNGSGRIQNPHWFYDEEETRANRAENADCEMGSDGSSFTNPRQQRHAQHAGGHAGESSESSSSSSSSSNRSALRRNRIQRTKTVDVQMLRRRQLHQDTDYQRRHHNHHNRQVEGKYHRDRGGRETKMMGDQSDNIYGSDAVENSDQSLAPPTNTGSETSKNDNNKLSRPAENLEMNVHIGKDGEVKVNVKGNIHVNVNVNVNMDREFPQQGTSPQTPQAQHAVVEEITETGKMQDGAHSRT